MEKGLDYIFNERTKMIILGTFPSIQSRDICYYNNPQNQFWRIIADVFQDDEIITGDKDRRYACLLSNGVGLWDVIQTCQFEQKSSLDSKISKDSIVYNNFLLLQQKCPALKCLVFNGKNAKKLFGCYLKQETNEAVRMWLWGLTNNGKNVLPSASPANARKKPEDKLREWKAFIKEHISGV